MLLRKRASSSTTTDNPIAPGYEVGKRFAAVIQVGLFPPKFFVLHQFLKVPGEAMILLALVKKSSG